ncbi:MAG: hypothetical protein A2015_05105 [Spirochaetes bacterium GWF1_31_7]|nr:MAG: hypothetical protein A2Y30_06505 [Spirochaetes bacterium GWE1_32_154]OHD47222.1 MAG: hypothetical protein A2015_05105 [Spirochaetes bacterium GWF1_31_7]OHD52634.1 MAG: hypothetical protein A2Y29_09660 [Spirochaetes bacterium GWE2_31_10]OHD73247.1 MAG: hypothetical protein A2355_16890 [Spirochaetes bacterium RIFOXYB1_FULL_32_8]HBD94299.1 MBL fold metallo-hydrolase [Spirochaetia bacterium]
MIEIIPILSDSNCYLLKKNSGFILFDTGFKAKRKLIENSLENAGVNQNNLNLIILSHGDIDHADNALYFKEKYKSNIAMNKNDEGMVINGDMSYNRKNKPDKIKLFFKLIIVLSKISGKKEQFDFFTPDIFLESGYSLKEYGFDATIIETPGHSAGSISIITDDGLLLCGDLLYNITGKPECLMIDNYLQYNESIHKLQKMSILKVYPGHGKPFGFNREIIK